MKHIINVVILLFILTNSLRAQNIPATTLSQGDLIDKIVAIVGKEIVLKSDIDAVILDEINRGGKYDINDKELRQKILNRFIDEKILITKAEEDSIVIDDNLVEERFNMAVQQLINYYGSIERLEAMYKKSLSRLKMEYKDDIKKNLMADQLQQKEFSGTAVNTKEISDFYDEVQDSLPMMPEQIEIYHIYKIIEPNTESREKTLTLAKKIRDSIIGGADFGVLAKEYSEDPGSKNEGGELGWVERGKFVAEFEMATIAMQKGEISMPVETPFGYHIIKLIDKNKDSIHPQHILFKLIQSEEDISRVKNFLDSLRKTALENNDFEELAKRYSDDAATKGFGGHIGKIMLSINPMGYSDVLSKLKDGEISEPLSFSTDPTKQGMHIVWRKTTIPDHKATINDDYEFLKAKAIEYKTMKLREKWLAELRKQIYWEVFE